MSYNYQDAPMESQQEYFGKVHTDNKETLHNALKRIEELEKENAELRYQLNKNPCVRIPEWYCSDCLKENETLKKQLEALSGDIPWNELKDVSEVTKKLTEAKEIIKDLLTLPFANDWEVYADVTSHLDRAEQFLKE